MKAVRISYSKTFISGHLKGMTVQAHIPVPATELQRNVLALVKMDKRNPVKEACTHNKFYVTDISWSEL